MAENLNVRGVDSPVAVSYSLLAALVRHIPLEESILKMQGIGISSIHYDIADEVITLPAGLSHELRKISNLPFDYHIANANPEDSIRNVKLSNGDFICAHLESSADWYQLSKQAKEFGANFGMAINVQTEWSELKPFVKSHHPDFVLIMAAEAGRSGGSFNFKTLEKNHRLREAFPKLRIHVDGGIDDLAAASLKGLDVQLLVSGSYIHSGSEARERVAFLRGVPDNPSLISLLRTNTPIVPYDATFHDILSAIDRGGIGCTAVVDTKGFYFGLITDFDIRTNISKFGLPIESRAEEICNKNSFTALPDEDFWSFMLRMQTSGNMHTVVPLVTPGQELVGILRTQDALFREFKNGGCSVSF